MTDINKQIEEQAKQILFKANKLPPEANYFGSVDHIKYSANEILKLSEDLKDSSRWRKVSEQLPEYGDIVVAKGDTSDFQDMYLIEIDSDYSMSVLTSYYKEWKPID